MTYCQLGKIGDVCSILPILSHEHKTTGRKPMLVVAEEYASCFDNLDYADLLIYKGHWQDLSGAMASAKRHYPKVIATQTYSKDFEIEKRQASFQLDQWERAGMLSKWDTLPLIIPRPEESIAKAIVNQHFKKPKVILYGDHSQSSPFPHREQLASLLVEHFGKDHQILRLSEVNLKNPMHLLALYDAADLLVTIETLHIHLAKASDVPMVVLATDHPSPWHGSAGSRRFSFYGRYGEFPGNSNQLLDGIRAALFQGRRPNNSIFRIRRTAAIGDVLCATVVADRLKEMGHQVEWQTHQDIKCVARRCNSIGNVVGSGGFAHVNLDNTYENDPDRRFKHFHQSFFESANKQLGNYGITLGKPLNCRPSLNVSDEERADAIAVLSRYKKPWVFICPRSNAHAHRTVPDETWSRAAQSIRGTKFWLGTKTKAPAGITETNIRHLDEVIQYLSVAHLLVTVDTGPMHIAAALGCPVVGIQQQSSPDFHLSDQRDFITISPQGLECLNCCANVCPIDSNKPPCQNIEAGIIASSANLRLEATFDEADTVSAVVAIYRPSMEVLNRGLMALLPQVREIIVVSDLAGKVPDGALRNPKIRYVVKQENDIGYGRKANFGARHTNSKHILFHNDDVCLEPDAVAKMIECMKPGVGMVSCLLRYTATGKIQHAGKIRRPGEMGWGHIDLNQDEPTWKEPTEQENTCGACVLVRRAAFYKSGCFDEDYFLYCDDDSSALSIRREGYKIIFTPHAKGIHDEHQSTWTTPRIQQIMQESNAIFGRKWGRYLEWNKDRIPGNFDYLLIDK